MAKDKMGEDEVAKESMEKLWNSGVSVRKSNSEKFLTSNLLQN